MSNQPGWYYNDVRQTGVDFEDEMMVREYDRKQGSDPQRERDLLARLGVDASTRVLEFGCGTGVFALEAAKVCAHVDAVDVSPTMLNLVRERITEAGLQNVTLHHAGFLSYKHQAAPVDLIVTQMAFHHLPDFWKGVALVRLRDMLKPGGLLYLQDVAFSFDPSDYTEDIPTWINRIANPDGGYPAADFETHVRDEYSTFTWIIEGLLERAGFEVVSVDKPDTIYARITARKQA